MADEAPGELSSTLDVSQPSAAPNSTPHDQPPPSTPAPHPQPSVPTSASEAPAPGAGTNTTNAIDTPVRRGPGRPKGSGKRQAAATELDDSSPRLKRPVGRPRKDGLPAGSLLPPRERKPAGRPRKSAPGNLGGDPQADNDQFRQQTFGGNVMPYPGAPMQGYFPQQPSSSRPQQWQAVYSANEGNHSVPPMASLQPSNDLIHPIDPELEKEEWAMLAHTRPNAFMRVLLASLSSPHPVPPVGPSIEDAFRSHLVSLTPKDGTGREHAEIPSLYSIMKTFWLPSSPAYFALTASASTARTPSAHRFLYWDPQPLLFNGLHCPVCAAPLANRGRIRAGPLKVHDLGAPFFIIGCEYLCRSTVCTQGGTRDGPHFASTDARILRSLPPALYKEFPAHLLHGGPETGGDLGVGPGVWNWQALGVSDALYKMVRGCLRAGLTKDAILSVIRGVQDGSLDDQWSQREEEEEDAEHEEEGREEEEQPTAAPESSSVAPDPAGPYYSAWKANAAVGEPQPPPNGQPVASSSTANPAPPPPQPYTPFPPQGYTPYPYAYGTWYQHPQHPAPGPGAPGMPPNLGDPTSLSAPKRQYAPGLDGSVGGEPPLKRVRHCCKCGSQDCKGKGGRAFCTNLCQDCGKLECQGRNSKRPDKTCRDAWP